MLNIPCLYLFVKIVLRCDLEPLRNYLCAKPHPWVRSPDIVNIRTLFFFKCPYFEPGLLSNTDVVAYTEICRNP